MTPSSCGTYAAYVRHVDHGETVCEPCKDANRRYHAEYRRRNPVVVERQKRTTRLRTETLRRLAALHPDDYQRIYYEVAQEDRAARETTS